MTPWFFSLGRHLNRAYYNIQERRHENLCHTVKDKIQIKTVTNTSQLEIQQREQAIIH